MQRAEQIVYEAGNKHGLAGAAQASDRQTDGRAFDELGEVGYT
jgi:hypothetical protein